MLIGILTVSTWPTTFFSWMSNPSWLCPASKQPHLNLHSAFYLFWLRISVSFSVPNEYCASVFLATPPVYSLRLHTTIILILVHYRSDNFAVVCVGSIRVRVIKTDGNCWIKKGKKRGNIVEITGCPCASAIRCALPLWEVNHWLFVFVNTADEGKVPRNSVPMADHAHCCLRVADRAELIQVEYLQPDSTVHHFFSAAFVATAVEFPRSANGFCLLDWCSPSARI